MSNWSGIEAGAIEKAEQLRQARAADDDTQALVFAQQQKDSAQDDKDTGSSSDSRMNFDRTRAVCLVDQKDAKRALRIKDIKGACDQCIAKAEKIKKLGGEGGKRQIKSFRT